MANFQLGDFTRRSEKLLNDTRKVFSQYKDLKDDLNVDENSLPKTMQPDDGAIKLVFVGQYSAGKSSIIKMLTGIDVTIGAGIATQEAHAYKWGDLEIVDTPGIHTEIEGSDHDEKTYYQIDHAALLIFVVTAQGFDNRMGNHFRKLAFEQDRAKNMVLVVNKMDQTALGNVPEQQKIIAEDLKKVFAGTSYTPEELYLSFTNTSYYFDWQTETDEEMKEILFEQSGYEKFIENLNKFVVSRGVLSKIQSPLETLKGAITTVLEESKKLDLEKDIKANEEIFERQEEAIKDGKRRIKIEIQELANTCAQKIKAEGEKAATEIIPGVSEDTIKRKIEDAQIQSEIYVKNCETEMISRLSDICEGINDEISLIDNSSFAENVRSNLRSKKLSVKKVDVGNAENLFNQMGGGTMAAKAFNLTSKGAKAIQIPSLNLSASEMVKNVGHLFDFKFKPWQAINTVKNVSNILGAVGLIFSAYQAYKKFSGNEEKDQKAAILEAQNSVINDFRDYAEDVQQKFVKVATQKMEEFTRPALQAAQDKVAESENNREQKIEMRRDLQNILNEIKILMDEVQRTAKA